jgi:hypothetical protein
VTVRILHRLQLSPLVDSLAPSTDKSHLRALSVKEVYELFRPPQDLFPGSLPRTREGVSCCSYVGTWDEISRGDDEAVVRGGTTDLSSALEPPAAR